MELNQLTIEQARQGLDNKEFTSIEITQACLKATKKANPKIQALMKIHEEEALEQARAADKLLKSDQASALTGIPLVLKDNLLAKDAITTGGSKILENYKAAYDATVVSKLKQAGAVFIGKANMDEFAMGSSTENSAFFKTKNPWDIERVPGGSSGGSAAATAADICLGALGSDTGGSIRQPASFCGVVGLKPTYGRVSRYGLMALSSSLDQVGPLAKTVKDSAMLYQAIAGHDSRDSTTVKQAAIAGDFNKDIKKLKIGIPKEYFIAGMDPEARQIVEQAIEKFKELGAEIIEVSLPLTKYALAIYQLTLTSEVSANLARYDGIRYGYSVHSPQSTVHSLKDVYIKSRMQGFGNETKRRIILGTYALSAGYYDQYYVQAQKARVLIKKEFEQIFKKVDCLVCPTTPTVAFKLGERYEDPLTMYLSDIYTVPANIGGVCALSVPCGFDSGLPVGLQIIARAFDENMLFRAGHQYEQATEWHKKRPKLGQD